MNKKIYFSIISSDSEEQAHGYVENDEVVYQDPLTGVYWTHEYPLTDSNIHIKNSDVLRYTQNYDENEFGIYQYWDYTFIINPQFVDEAFLNTRVSVMIPTNVRGYKTMNIGDLLSKVHGYVGKFIRDAPNEAHVNGSYDGIIYANYRIRCDAEMMDAIESVITRMGTIESQPVICWGKE